MADLLALFEKGLGRLWRPQSGEAVYLLLGQTVVSGVIQGHGEKTHWSGQPERWYFFLPDDSMPDGQTIACGINSLRPKN